MQAYQKAEKQCGRLSNDSVTVCLNDQPRGSGQQVPKSKNSHYGKRFLSGCFLSARTLRIFDSKGLQDIFIALFDKSERIAFCKMVIFLFCASARQVCYNERKRPSGI